MRLELGAGHRPTRGYEHNDLYPFDHIEHVGAPWMLELPNSSVEEVLALGFVEHLTYDQARDTFRNVHRMLKPDGLFLFDVPDYPVWCEYYLAALSGRSAVGIPMEHVRKTLFGWQRWPGDEHKSGWDEALINQFLHEVGYTVRYGVEQFRHRTFRRRFFNSADAHLYVQATK